MLEMVGRAAESAHRHLGESPRTNQVLTATAIARGAIAELPTGEGKTLAAALTAAAWGLGRDGVHVMTANAYLAWRDATWMQPLLAGVGLSVASIPTSGDDPGKRAAYRADVVYGTHLELGFDLLRDGLVASEDERRQRGHGSLIIDEADSLLVDEGRIPLVLSGPGRSTGDLPYRAAEAVELLDPEAHYDADPSRGMVWLTERGTDVIEDQLGTYLFGPGDSELLRHVQHALRARALYRRNRDYIVRGGAIGLVDAYSGRVIAGRRWSEGLHQAVEAKERLTLSMPRATYARTSIRSLVRMYRRVGGMTATASELMRELRQEHELEVVVVSPHVPSRRRDHPDAVFDDIESKLAAVVAEVTRRHRRRQPLVVGCGTVQAADVLSQLLEGAGIEHVVLTARDDAHEATVIAEAGRAGAVTVATHLAGRGVDIKLGGARADIASAAEAVAAGGLCVIGTERYESPRIERQLRGRAGRQGEPGESIFFVSPDDPSIAAWAPARQSSPARRMAIAQANLHLRNTALREDLNAFGEVFERHRQWARARRDAMLRTDPVRLPAFDERWIDHLAELHELLDSIHFRAWAADVPLAAWHRESRRLLEAVETAGDLPVGYVDVPDRPPSMSTAAWLDRLGPRQEEPPEQVRRGPRPVRGSSSAPLNWGAGVMVDVIAVSDVDGGRWANESVDVGHLDPYRPEAMRPVAAVDPETQGTT